MKRINVFLFSDFTNKRRAAMKKKRFIVLILSFVMLLTFTNLNTEKVYAATFPSVNSAKTIQFIATKSINIYTNTDLRTRGTSSPYKKYNAYIDVNDLCYIHSVTANNSLLISYPTSSGYKKGYCKRSDVLYVNEPGAYYKSAARVSTYKKPGGASYGYIAVNDSVYICGSASGYKGVIYNISGGKFKFGWIKSADLFPIMGMTDVTQSFSGKKLIIQSKQNGKYLCADANIANTPAVCNRGSAATSSSSWEIFTVTVTSDKWAGFKAHNGRWLSARINTGNCPVQATAGNLLSWECFRIYKKGSDYYLLSQANSKWLSVRIDKNNAPVWSSAPVASTWERFSINFVNTETKQNTSSKNTIVSQERIDAAASKYAIGKNTNAYKALLSINTKYYSRLSSQKTGTLVFLFEGVGNNSSCNKRLNAMCVVVKNGSIVYLNRNSSTIPDYPFNPSKNGGDPMPTIKSGVYGFTTVNHRSTYAALNVSAANVVRFKSKSNYYNSTSAGINVHRRSSDSISASGNSWVNSAGCQLIGKSGTNATSEYAKFIQAVGIVPSGSRGDVKYKTSVSGKIIIDRTYAFSYLSGIGYSNDAIGKIGY